MKEITSAFKAHVHTAIWGSYFLLGPKINPSYRKDFEK
jgi:hypothetical protein